MLEGTPDENSSAEVPLALVNSTAERQEQLAGVLEDGPMTTTDLVERLGWPASTVRHVLRVLIKQRTVKRTARSPRSPHQSYRLT